LRSFFQGWSRRLHRLPSEVCLDSWCGVLHARITERTRLSHGMRVLQGLELRTWTQTWRDRQSTASGVREYRLRRRDGGALRDIGDRGQKARNIKGLARAALERDEQVGAYRTDAVDRGRFQGVHSRKQPGRRERGSGGEDSRENPAIPWGTGAVLLNPAVCREHRRTTIRIQQAYNPLTAARTGPWSSAAWLFGSMPVRSAVTAAVCVGVVTRISDRVRAGASA